jgi:acetyltransferase
MGEQLDVPNQRTCRVMLPDGTPTIVRPIRRNGGPQLAAELAKLSPDSRYQRFLSPKSSFSPGELDFLTNCDGVNHLALVLVVTDTDGHELRSVAVARCVRDSSDVSLAEVAVVVADEWQRRGIGKLLFKELANQAWKAGIRRWRAFFLSGNIGIRKLMEVIGTKQFESLENYEVVEVVYNLFPPSTSVDKIEDEPS